MSVIPVIRRCVLGVVTLFALIALALSAHIISFTGNPGGYFIFCALGVAAGSITLVTLPAMAVVDILRRGAFTSMIVVEVAWLSVLWILWVATAAEAANGYASVLPDGCGALAFLPAYLDPALYIAVCREGQAVEAFSFLNFIILLLYSGFLFVIAVVAANGGRNIWFSSVREIYGSPAGPVEHPMTHYNASGQPVPVGTHAQPQYAAPTPGAGVSV